MILIFRKFSIKGFKTRSRENSQWWIQIKRIFDESRQEMTQPQNPQITFHKIKNKSYKSDSFYIQARYLKHYIIFKSLILDSLWFKCSMQSSYNILHDTHLVKFTHLFIKFSTWFVKKTITNTFPMFVNYDYCTFRRIVGE